MTFISSLNKYLYAQHYIVISDKKCLRVCQVKDWFDVRGDFHHYGRVSSPFDKKEDAYQYALEWMYTNGNILHFPNEDAAIYVTKLEEVKNNLSKKGNTKMIQSSKLKEVQAHYEGNVELLTSSHRDRDIDEVKRKMYY